MNHTTPPLVLGALRLMYEHLTEEMYNFECKNLERGPTMVRARQNID
jgi:hypothetical protein